MKCESMTYGKRRESLKTYIFNLFLEVIGGIAVLHEKHNFLVVLRIIVELYNVFVLHLRLNGAFLSRVVNLHLIHELVFLNAFFNDSLERNHDGRAHFIGLFVCGQRNNRGRELYFVDLLEY